ncbi:MAG: acyl-ACP--UDP-N-acetylglucosamine O-acyltransferase [Armatimonadia bacterium]|nr:acyl-ACP--UDP-N-acetylglucosamine O-acyltransferase [Armatimonadia bacterium]
MAIHQTAIVDPGAELGESVEVGPFSIIEGGVTIGANCTVGPHCVIKSGVTMGSGNRLDVGVVLGSDPQDAKYDGERSFVEIGNNNLIREYVTIHRATGEDEVTSVGDNNFLMAYAHLGHNVRIGSNCSLASFAGLSGHCIVQDRAIIGGLSGLHQYVTVGRMCMIGGHSRVTRDIPPFTTAQGNDVHAINIIGLQRNDVSREEQTALREAFKTVYRSDLNTSDAIDQIRSAGELSPLVEEFITFIEQVNAGGRGRQQG